MAVEAQGRRREAKAWLEDLLASGPVAAKKIEEEAKAAGMSWATVRRAKDVLSIVANKSGLRGGWEWQLKDAHHEDAQREDAQREDAQVSAFDDAHHANVSAFEQTASIAKDAQMSAFEERDGRLFLSGKAWQDLEVTNLPARHKYFAELVSVNPPAAGEDIVELARRIRRLCDEKNIFLPRPFYARCRATA